MMPRSRGLLRDGLKIAVAVAIYCLLERQVDQVRRDLKGNACGIAEAQSRSSEELSETRKLLHTVLEDSNLQFAQARKIFEQSKQALEGERRELARLIDDRTGAIATTLKDRLETERDLLEGARTHAATNVALIERLEHALDRDPARMKRMMVYPTVQLRGCGTVGSGVLIYSRNQGEGPKPPVVTLILTAYHVVQEVSGGKNPKGDVDEIHVLGENDVFEPEVYTAELVISDRDRDIALLWMRSPRRFQGVAELATRETLRELDVFTRAYAVGCPLGNRPLPTLGEITSKSKVVGDQVFWMLNAPTFFGNSGGGIYLAANCQLIGISSMIYTYGKDAPTVVPHMGLFISLESICDWLEAQGYSFLIHGEPLPPSLEARFGLRRPASPPAAGRAAAAVSSSSEPAAGSDSP
jgi:hypothetical protein